MYTVVKKRDHCAWLPAFVAVSATPPCISRIQLVEYLALFTRPRTASVFQLRHNLSVLSIFFSTLSRLIRLHRMHSI